ncbi:hypothetical protein YEP_phi_CDS00045 [Yersinia phage Yep-phi]|uniref:Uncharacterized protein n=1 Tax=Yersinia phage Yep-phi TaxID=928293 RepID=E5L7G1_9CAUD|nr:hypothetical protein CM12_gp45 [Yersinia phage Yep-phi]ADQ83199.1 hypothetical protein YEP_phi_CDS00045 [Yersinia phage Yep-phi]
MRDDSNSNYIPTISVTIKYNKEDALCAYYTYSRHWQRIERLINFSLYLLVPLVSHLVLNTSVNWKLCFVLYSLVFIRLLIDA